ncbi:MAG TPA: pentapeptide repeat-containing protein, partial [Pyrinomonadaceae bacterium]|nr:pentapeptide repeat-containing protein [Pyrinomonadaceae bacterium]
LVGAKLTGCDLSNASFQGANLSKAILANANLSNANLTNAIIDKAVVTGARIANHTDVNLTNHDLPRACCVCRNKDLQKEGSAAVMAVTAAPTRKATRLRGFRAGETLWAGVGRHGNQSLLFVTGSALG